MKLFLKKIIKKYRDMSVEMKAAVLVCSGKYNTKNCALVGNDYTDALLSY